MSKTVDPPRRPENVGLAECVAFVEEMVRKAEGLDPRRRHPFRIPGFGQASWIAGREQVDLTRKVLRNLGRGDPMVTRMVRAWVVQYEKVQRRKGAKA
jgi:hypothetical protein